MTSNLYKQIAERKTPSQRWNDLSDDERLAYYRLAQGIYASVKLHHADEKDVAKYLMQYATIKQEG